MSASVQEIKSNIIGAWPPGTEDLIDWEDAPGHHVEAIANVVKDELIDTLDELEASATPLTAVLGRVKDWERTLEMSQSKAALHGELAQRRAQVFSRLREYGATTIAMIQAVVGPLLDFADVTDLVVSECDRFDLRDEHTYPWGVVTGGTKSFSPGTPATFKFRVLDDGQLSPSGAQLDLNLTFGDLTKLGITLTSPTGSSITVSAGTQGRGALTADDHRVYLKSLTATSVMGLWTCIVTSTLGSGTVHSAELFVEGWGRDSIGNPGLSAAKYEWGVIDDPDFENGNPDYDAARTAIKRINYATRIGALIFQDSGGELAAGDYAAIPDDDRSIPDACIPG